MAFQDTAGLILLANLAPRHLVLDFDGYEWQEGDGLRFASLMKTPFVENLFADVRELGGGGLDAFLSEADMNIVEITGDVRPHFHSESDVVLRCLTGDASVDSVYSSVSGHNFWRPIYEGELIVLPRGAKHAFRRAGKGEVPFYLLDFGYPPLAEQDVTYID